MLDIDRPIGRWVELLKLDKPDTSGRIYSMSCVIKSFGTDLETFEKGIPVIMGVESSPPVPTDGDFNEEFIARYSKVDPENCVAMIDELRINKDSDGDYILEGFYIPFPTKDDFDDISFKVRGYTEVNKDTNDKTLCLKKIITYDVNNK